jgi:hypothetical protein
LICIPSSQVIIGYLQVTSALYGSFSSIVWPQNYRNFLGAFQFLSLNPVNMVMPSCLDASW